MAVKGSLREASLADVVQLLALGQKTGCLSVSDRSSFGSIYFDRGEVSYASIVNRRDRLGDLLVRDGLLTPEMLATAVGAQDAWRGKRLGEILIGWGAITPEQLERYIRIQIEEAVYFLFTWTQGAFSFSPDQRPEDGAMLVAIDAETLLLEGARRVDEWSVIEKKIPSTDLVFALTPAVADRSATELSAEQRRILPLMDGTRTVRELGEESALGEFEVGKALFGLIQAGLARHLGRKVAAASGDGRPARIEEHRNLGVAFYRTGMLAEAAREFERVAEGAPHDPAAPFYRGLVDLRLRRPRAALRRFQEAVQRGAPTGPAFHDAALALEQLGLVDDALLALGEATSVLAGSPPLLLSRAILLCKAGRAHEAAAAFAAYRACVGDGDRAPAAYYAFAMIAEGARGGLAEARRLAEEGARIYPHVAPVLLHAGLVQERAGLPDEAEMLYRRALQEDSGLAPARMALGDALSRRGAYAHAAEQYQALLDSATCPDDAAFKLGVIRYRDGDRPEALRLWRLALELNPDHAAALTNLELVERAEGK